MSETTSGDEVRSARGLGQGALSRHRAMGVAAEAASLRERGPSVLERRRLEDAAEEAFEEAFDANAVRGRVRLHAISQAPGGWRAEGR